jgi:hypothetical protein
MGRFLINLLLHRTADVKEVARTVPSRARRDTVEWDRPDPTDDPKDARHDYLELLDEYDTPTEGVEAFRKQQSDLTARQNYHTSQLAQPDEEVDMLDFDVKDELEDIFDDENVRVGVYDKDEVDYYVGMKVQAEVSNLKKRKQRIDEDAFLLRVAGYDEQTLNDVVERARQILVRNKKLLPPGPPWKRPPKGQPAARTKVAPRKKASPKKKPAPKRKASPKKKPAPNTKSAPQRRSQRHRPPNESHPQSQVQTQTQRSIPTPVIDGLEARELPSPAWSPISVAGDVDMLDVPQGLEQLDQTGDEGREPGVKVAVTTELSPMEMQVLLLNIVAALAPEGMTPAERSDSGDYSASQGQEQSNGTGDEDGMARVEASVPIESSLPIRGVKRTLQEMGGVWEDFGMPLMPQDSRDGTGNGDGDCVSPQKPHQATIKARLSERVRKRPKWYKE